MRLRQASERRNALARQKRKREREDWEACRAERKRAAYDLRDKSERYMKAQSRAVQLERYVTAMWGCKTSWARVEAHGKYYAYYSKRFGPRAERPERGGDWAFNPHRRTLGPGPVRAPVAA